ncbi:MAG: ABC transporter ATP-binding protein [Christensenellales bacterium]|jgi:ATP-binding cassette subfamily B multidrug efflux pump
MKKTVMKRMLSYLRPYRGMLVSAFAAALVSVPLALLGPVFIGEAIDAAVGPGDVNFPLVIRSLIWLGLTILGSAALSWLSQFFTRKISAGAAQDMRSQAFESINRAPLSKIDTSRHGDIVSRLVNDADAVSEGFLQTISQLLPGIVTIVATIVVMCLLNIWIALVVIFVTPASIWFARFVGTRTSSYFRQQSQTQGRLSGYINEMVGNQPLVQALGFEEKSADEFADLADDYYEASFKATFYSSVINPGTRFVNAVVYAAVAVFGAIYALSGGISVGGLSVFLSYATQYTRPFNEVTAVLTQVQSAIASAERLFELMDWEKEKPDAETAAELKSVQGHVEAKDVFFSYDPSRPLIQNLSFEAKPGMRIALVGPTGCGKTTMINLLMRFYDIDSGKISVDGININEIKRNRLRGRFGMVLQDTWLKGDTVHANIAYARPGASRQEVIDAAETAHAHSFIMRLPKGYDTVIGAGGESLSEGQRQLLCIARIVLARPNMLILDEATSSIDTRTELIIQRALENLMRGHTSFIVAHRLSTIQNADLILVMVAGEIVERGSHDELLQKQGFYKKLYESQFAGQQT